MNQTLVGYLALLGSVALHGVAVTRSAGEPARRRPPAPPSFVELTRPEPLPEPPVEPPRPPERELLPKPPRERPRPAPSVEEPLPEPPAPEAEQPPRELTGVTLTGGEGASFGAPQGNGGPREGAIATGIARKEVPPRLPPVRAAAPASPALPLSKLSRRPVPPSLEAALERNYPREARGLGKSGEAKVQARVEASGEIRSASIVFATSPDFGDACRRTLVGTRWSTPLDGNGKPAATSIYYRCKFRVD